MADRLHVDAPPCGSTKLSEWAKEHRATLGVAYPFELARRLDRARPYHYCRRLLLDQAVGEGGEAT